MQCHAENCFGVLEKVCETLTSPPPHQPSPVGSASATPPPGGSDWTIERACNLIMKEKEKLLSLETPLKFIFSHSALREGWDNPNVFQICTLRDIRTERPLRGILCKILLCNAVDKRLSDL